MATNVPTALGACERTAMECGGKRSATPLLFGHNSVSCADRTHAGPPWISNSPQDRTDRFNNFELIFNPALLAASLLIWNRILVPSRTKLIIPPVSVKPGVSPTVNTLRPLNCLSICGNRAFSELLINRIWQLVASVAARNSLITTGCSSTDLFLIVFSSASRNGFSPRTPTTIGEDAFANAAAGHSTNLAKLKIKAALI